MPALPTFTIQKISAISAIPLRNIHDEFIFGSHILWEPNQVIDESDICGSIAPNGFAHDFVGPIPATAHLTVTVNFSDEFPDSKEYRLYGTIQGIQVIESDSFIPSAGEINVDVKVVQPATSNRPFSWSGDFIWTLEKTLEALDNDRYVHLETTRLELYWVSKDVHDIFLSGHAGIAIELLRAVIPNFAVTGLDTLESVGAFDPSLATGFAYQYASKTYDTTSGKPHFGVNSSGGAFQYKNYIAKANGGAIGSLQPVVNCYDQAAIVQVIEALGKLAAHRPSWLLIDPCGYIWPTILVGIPALCNNPFFKSNNSPQYVGSDDPRRTGFANHSFNGILTTFSVTNDVVYDACEGPIDGVSPTKFVSEVVDTNTTLKVVLPGKVTDIKRCDGVTSTVAFSRPSDVPSKGVEALIRSSASNHPSSSSYLQTQWDNVPAWIQTVVGKGATVAFHSNRFADSGEGFEGVWHLTNVDYDGKNDDLIINFRVHTSPSSEGTLDLQSSSSAALDSFRHELTNTNMSLGEDYEDLNKLWEPSPVAQKFAQYAVQFASHIQTRGRMLIVSGNCFIEIYGGSSSASLEPLVRKLLSHTTTNQPLSFSIPKPNSHQLNIPEGYGGTMDNIIRGVGISFNVRCQLPHPVSFASANTKDAGLLMKGYTIELGSNENDEGGLSIVNFEFVTYKVGTYDVKLHFARTGTLTSGMKSIEIVVVE